MNHFAEGVIAFERGDLTKAMQLLSLAIAAGENVAAARSKRGVCFLKSGDPDSAERDFRAALVADEQCVSAMVNLGNLMLERNAFDEAKLYYDRALRVDDTYAFAHYNLGVWHRKRGDLPASIRELRLAAKYEAKPVPVKKRIGWWKRR